MQHQAAQEIAWQDLINKKLTRLEAPRLRPQSACLEEVQAREHTTNVKHRHRYNFHHSPFSSLLPRGILRLIPALQRLLKRPPGRPGRAVLREEPLLLLLPHRAAPAAPPAPAPRPQEPPLCPAPTRGSQTPHTLPARVPTAAHSHSQTFCWCRV